MSVTSLIKAQLVKRNKLKKDKEKLFLSLARIAANKLEHVAIKCRCGDISIPTEKKGNVYRCIRCDKEKVFHSYNLERTNYTTISSNRNKLFLDMDFYDAAVILLKNDKKKRPTLKERKYRLKSYLVRYWEI